MGWHQFNDCSQDYQNNPIELWKDLLNYSSNLRGNWMFSKHIFYTRILPLAEKDPEIFAKWVRDMVKKSGTKIKSKSEFFEAIKYLRKLKGNSSKNEVKRALYYLLNSGLDEPTHALRALDKLGS